jgi:hypothetical protein
MHEPATIDAADTKLKLAIIFFFFILLSPLTQRYQLNNKMKMCSIKNTSCLSNKINKKKVSQYLYYVYLIYLYKVLDKYKYRDKILLQK